MQSSIQSFGNFKVNKEIIKEGNFLCLCVNRAKKVIRLLLLSRSIVKPNGQVSWLSPFLFILPARKNSGYKQ